jgi:ribosomal protein L11 methyltransferase
MIRLAVRVRSERAEIVLAELLELAPAGVEEVELPDGTIEYAVYGAPGEVPDVPDLQAVAGGELVAVTSSELEDDWAERWKSFHRPVVVTAAELVDSGGLDGRPEFRALRIRPPWDGSLAGSASGAMAELVIDPGQAFGTGAHAKTRLCLELLLGLAAADASRGAVLDVGAGTGVLAIAAARLGFAPVLAIDNELESVRAAAGNAAANGVEVEVRRADLRTDELASDGPPQLITANLLRPLLLSLCDSLPWTPGELIAGGLLAGETDEVAAAFAERHGMRELSRLEEGGWAALLLSAGRQGSGSSVAARTIER